MTSRAQTPMAAVARQNAARGATPIQTSTDSNVRYSYMETPQEMQRSTFEQFSSPTNSTIDESPITPSTPGRGLPAYPHGSQPTCSFPLPTEKTPAPSLQQMHPALYKYKPPIAETQTQETPARREAQSPGPIPVKVQERPSQHAVKVVNDTFQPPPTSAIERRGTYNPDSLSGMANFFF